MHELFASSEKRISVWMVFGLIAMAAFNAHAETVYYTLDNVILEDSTQMKGVFSWTYDIGDFENGIGQFTSLDIPWTSHDHDDLDAVFDIGSSIEITLEGSVHDDGVDIALFLSQPLTPDTSSSIDVVRSKYEIGGNGFHDGLFVSGSIAPTNLNVIITASSPGFATISWEPNTPGYVLQKTASLSSDNWMDSASGSTNPIVVPFTSQAMFYRLAKP